MAFGHSPSFWSAPKIPPCQIAIFTGLSVPLLLAINIFLKWSLEVPGRFSNLACDADPPRCSEDRQGPGHPQELVCNPRVQPRIAFGGSIHETTQACFVPGRSGKHAYGPLP